MKPLCIYHADCADGFGAAYAAWKKFGNGADYVACNYGRPPPAIEEGQDIYIVDFSFPRDTLMGMAPRAAKVVVLDHHKTARDALAGEWPASFDVRFDMTKSGARMAWEFFHESPPPRLIEYIEDRDLWLWKLPGSKAFSAALRSYPFNFAIWDDFDVDALIMEGRAIDRYVTQQVDGLASLAQRAIVGGVSVPAINGPAFLASELGNKLAQGEPFAAIWSASPKEMFWSLRSTDAGLDVSAIAKMYGGGGHRNAAGFSVPIERYSEFL